MLGSLILGAIAAASAPAAPGHGETLRAYPGIRHDGAFYAVATDKKGRITDCLPIDPKADASKTRAACAALTAKGVPADITPAVARGESALWFPSAEYPAEAIPAHSIGSVTLVYEIDEAGTAKNCMVHRSSGIEMLDYAACRAVLKRARFTPARYKGKPVYAAVIATYSYESE